MYVNDEFTEFFLSHFGSRFLPFEAETSVTLDLLPFKWFEKVSTHIPPQMVIDH